MAPQFVWGELEGIVQAPLIQTKDGCAFTATTRQIEYQLRIAYAEAKPPIKFGPEPLFDHKLWETKLGEKVKEKTRWKPWDLLHEANDRLELTKINKVFTEKEGDGVPDANGLPHWVRTRKTVIPFHGESDEVKLQSVGKLLNEKTPIVAVLHYLISYYPRKAEFVYTGLKEDGTSALAGLSPVNVSLQHAVCIVGVEELKDGNPYKVQPGTYWLYQDSLQLTDTDTQIGGLHGNMIGLLHPRVVIEAYYGKSRIDNLLLGPLADNEVQILNKELSSELGRERENLVVSHRAKEKFKRDKAKKRKA